MNNVEIHVAGLWLTPSYKDAGKLKPLPHDVSIKGRAESSMHNFVIPNATSDAGGGGYCVSPHASENYTLEEYLSKEADDGFALVFIGPFMIITQSYEF